MFKVLQKVGKAFMLPIAILPAAGLLLGIGGALSNPTTIATYPILDNSFFSINIPSNELCRRGCIQ
jgi:phosphotransferase system sugar-specific EII component